MKITIESIQEQLKEKGWTILSTQYTNLKTPMQFKCDEGHLIELPWEKLRNKLICPVCKQNILKKVEKFESKPKTKEYRILALDQSSHITGYAIYDVTKLINYGKFCTTKNDPLERISQFCDWLDSIIYTWNPDELGLEETQYNPNCGIGHDVFKLLSQVMGAAIITGLRGGCKVNTVLIPTWRHHCGVKGNKRADQKKSAQLLVKQWYDISVTDDESDAICIGKYFADTYAGKSQIIGDWE